MGQASYQLLHPASRSLSSSLLATQIEWNAMCDQQHHDPDRLARLEQNVEGVRRKIHTIERQLLHMADQAEVDQITKELGDVKTGLATVAGDVSTAQSTLQDEINKLATASPELDLSGLQAGVTDLVSAVAPIDTAVKALGSLAPISATEPTPPNTPTSSPDKAVYKYTAAEGVEPDERFTESGFETVPAAGAVAEALLYFNGDAGPGETNGAVVPGYTVYDGTIQPTPAA